MQLRLLRPDNFTPATRTPWGGRRILDHYKRDLTIAGAADLEVCGESWEVSVEPSFPSRFADTDEPLGEAIANHPAAWLGHDAVARGQRQTPLLVKLLDARDNLSVQVHPDDHDPALNSGESGKFESWYILDADEGAVVYMGFRDGVGKNDVERCLRGSGQLDDLLNPIPVTPGDAFVIAPGTVHAIAAGITLIEPQSVLPDRRAVTYRYWDWNRRYDRSGAQSPRGKPRELHIDRALAVTDWNAPRGEEFVAACRTRSELLDSGPLRRERVSQCRYFVLERWSGTGVLRVPAQNGLLAAVCVAGSARLQCQTGDSLIIRRGQSIAVPARAGDIELITADRAEAAVELLVTRAKPR
ncbi:MAG: class I mannose-6-phosphate isomerase [Proteobacteria bacterium]|nr:class I mannose-6-phosphate isomerase [Pseudomonadota bacterium]